MHPIKYLFKIFLAICLLMTLTGCQQPIKNQVPTDPVILINYTKKQVEEETEAFDLLVTSLIPELMDNAPLSASFKYDHLDSLGLSKLNSQLDDLSTAHFNEMVTEANEALSALSEIDYSLLDLEKKATYDMLVYHHQLVLQGMEYLYYSPLVEPSSGIQTNLLLALIQLDLESVEDIDAYLMRLDAIPLLMNQVIDFENQRKASGLLLPSQMYETVLKQLESILIEPEEFILYVSFCDKIGDLTLTQDQVQVYEEKCLDIVKNQILPAYENLKATVQTFIDTPSDTLGVCSYPSGKNYYNYLIFQETSYPMTGEELMTFVQGQINNCLAKLRGLYDTNPELFSMNLQEALPVYDSMEDLYQIEEQCMQDLFYDYDVERAKEFTIPDYLEDYVAAGFYFPVSIDGSGYGNMYLQESAYTHPNSMTLELFFHENIPGHHLYFSEFYMSDAPLIRKILSWLPYEEGWAQYIQSSCMTYYGLSEELTSFLKLIDQLSYYYMMRLDIQYHYEGISYDEALKTYIDLGYSEDAAKKALNRMIANPGEIIHYIYGAYKMESYLEACQSTLGSAFDIKAFHDLILTHGGLPFSTMDKIVENYIKAH